MGQHRVKSLKLATTLFPFTSGVKSPRLLTNPHFLFPFVLLLTSCSKRILWRREFVQLTSSAMSFILQSPFWICFIFFASFAVWLPTLMHTPKANPHLSLSWSHTHSNNTLQHIHWQSVGLMGSRVWLVGWTVSWLVSVAKAKLKKKRKLSLNSYLSFPFDFWNTPSSPFQNVTCKLSFWTFFISFQTCNWK